MAHYARAFATGEVDRAARVRRTALEATPGQSAGPGLASWSTTAATRVERMREIEPGLTAEVTRLASLTDRSADRRVLAYAAAFLLAASALVVLLVLAPGRARRARTSPDTLEPWLPVPSPPEGERSRTGKGGRPVVHTPPATSPSGASPSGAPPSQAASLPEAGPGLADLARRSQDLVDQQLELLDQVSRDQGDPKLPGRLLQVDRLAVRARRNAHNLIVLAGGEPARHWDGPAPLGEVAALAVSDNPDAARVDLDVAGDLLVAGPAAEDLANLLAELVDNATAFSAPETRVRVGGQEVGSGYVLEVEDRGLGMTDGELETVNRRLAGDPAAGDDLEQRLGAWVAGRLARRHDVRVQLRRSPYGGVTALVFLPELLVSAAEPDPPAGSGDPPPDVGEDTAALASLPPRRYVTQVPEADPPLPKRAPHASLAPDLVPGSAAPGNQASRPAARSPEQVRSMLTRYRSGLERGRAAAARDLPDDPDDDPPTP
jgi:signal transduction histidine kinase